MPRPDFDGFKNFDHHDLIAKQCNFRLLEPPDADGIKMFEKGSIILTSVVCLLF